MGLFFQIPMRRLPFRIWNLSKISLTHNPDVIVIVDEAYIDFAGEWAITLIDKYENLIVIQTFSKARSMAGMRIGYAISNKKLIRYLSDVKYSFNSYTMNQTSLLCGVESVRDQEYFQGKLTEIKGNERVDEAAASNWVLLIPVQMLILSL